MHGGAQTATFPLTVPGFKGLNTQKQGALLGPEWATKLENTVIDSNGRVSARKGWLSVTTSAHGDPFKSGIEYRKQDGTIQLVVTSDTKILSSTDGTSWTDVTGTAAFTDGNWHLVNFNDYVLGFQQGEKALIYNGTAGSQVADVDAPTGKCGTSAFGRIWQSSADNTVLHFSGLLDHTAWGASDLFDLSSVWPGNDTIAGVTAFNNLLVVFGVNNILVFADNTGSELGIDPTQMVVVDVIPGIGLYSQHSIQHVNGDIWFVDNSLELRSFSRVMLDQKSGNIAKLSTNVSDRLRDSIASGSFPAARLRSGFSPQDRFYLLSLPTESAPGVSDEVGKCFVFDTRAILEDGSARCVGIWNQMVPTVIIVRNNGTVYSALSAEEGELGKYIGNRDDGATYRLVYESGWIDITQQNYILILKRLNGLFFFNVDTSVFMKWAFDFSTNFYTRELSFSVGAGTGMYGVSEWGIGEFGGGVDLLDKKVPGAGTGTYIKVGAEAVINGGTFAIQQIDLIAKVGRLKG